MVLGGKHIPVTGILSEIVKSAIRAVRLTVREVDVRNPPYFSNMLVGNRRWQTR